MPSDFTVTGAHRGTPLHPVCLLDGFKKGQTMASAQTQARKINWRSIALPAEHGGWSLILEPIVLGLILAPSWIALSLSIAMMAVFLSHQPVKISLKAYRTGKWTERSRFALYFAAGYLLGGGLFAIPALLQSNSNFWLIIALIVPFALIQAFQDFQNQSRSATAEITGAIALSGTVALLLVLSDWQLTIALPIWFVIALRAVTSILYVRTFFRKQRGKDNSVSASYVMHIIVMIIVMGLAFAGFLPYLTVVPFVILLIRAVHGLQSDKQVKPQIIGIREVMVGILTVACIASGFIFNL